MEEEPYKHANIDKKVKENVKFVISKTENEIKSLSETRGNSVSQRKRQIAENIEKDIKFLLENPIKLRRFKTQIEMIKERIKKK